MARKIRIEYEGAYYHVINRGNYREWIFDSAGARKSFLACLEQCCAAQGWRVHAWCLMSNHYHLLIETPEANLVAGMRWLQSTFANRFNRFRKENGHVFQGRYKAILLEGGALGPVCHYIHLNPVRAGLVPVERLESYESSSFRQLWRPRQRWKFGNYGTCLEGAGGLADTSKGRRMYRGYLGWLSENEAEQKRLAFEKMCRGWAKGTNEFKREVLDERRPFRVIESEAREARTMRWERSLERALACVWKTHADLKSARKGEAWKVALARYMREECLASNSWIAESLHMGTPNSLSSLISRHRKERPCNTYVTLRNQEYVDL